MNALSNKSVLVHLSVSQWQGSKVDKRATNTVVAQHKTENRVGNYTKKLLPGSSELANINALSHSIRQFFYYNTLPWLSDGTRILSSKNYMDFTAEFKKMKYEFTASVDSFLKEYSALKSSAQLKLGDLFNELEYPSEEYLRRRFACDISIMPLPDVGDFRTDISDVERNEFIDKMREVEINATRECFERLNEVVLKAAQTLNNPDAKFKNSLFNNISEICQLLPKLNVTDDAKLESVRQETEALVSRLSPDLCRENETERNNAAKALAEITDKMSIFMTYGEAS